MGNPLQDMHHWAVFSLISIFIWIILFPLLLIHARTIWLYRKVNFVEKRNPSILISFSFIGTTIHMLARTYYGITTTLKIDRIDIGFAGNKNLHTLSISTTMLWVLLLDCVLWISYFNWKKSTQLLKTQWKEQLLLIDKIHNKRKTKQSWILRYGKLLSNIKYILMISVIYYLIYVAIILYFGNTEENDNGYKRNTISVIVGGIPTLPPIMLCFLARKLLDTLGIGHQLRDVGIIIMAAFILLVLNIYLVPFGAYRVIMTYAICQFTSVFVGIRMLYVKDLSAYVKGLKSRTRARSCSSDPNKSDPYTFSDVWNNKKLFQSFANHTVTEYSVETLLFILEFNQFREYVIDSHKDLISDADEQRKFIQSIEKIKSQELFCISDDILKIDHSTSLTMLDFIKTAQYLYDTYIDDDSLIQVNIPGNIRKLIVRAFNKHHLLDKRNASTPKIRQKVLPMIVIHSYNVLPTPKKSNAIDKNIRRMMMDIIESLDNALMDLYLLSYKDSWPRFKKTEEYMHFVDQAKEKSPE
eukprot:455971_1